MAHVAKYTKGAMGHLMKHFERGKDGNGEYIKFGNESIDTSLSELNYNLAPHQNQLDFIHKRLSEVHCLKRKDVNVMCSWVVSAPKELPEEHTKEFFQRTYDFLEKKYGKQNVISAYVHMDETTPHMHFAFVPVVYDKKKDRYKVSAKEVITKAELNSFHKELQAEMDKFVAKYEHEFECNVLNGATANGNKSIQELKADTLEELVDEETERINELMAHSSEEMNLLEQLKDDVSELKALKKDLISARNSLYDDLTKLSEGLKRFKNNDTTVLSEFLQKKEIRAEFERFKAEFKKENSKNLFSAEELKAKSSSFAEERNQFNSLFKGFKAKKDEREH